MINTKRLAEEEEELTEQKKLKKLMKSVKLEPFPSFDFGNTEHIICGVDPNEANEELSPEDRQILEDADGIEFIDGSKLLAGQCKRFRLNANQCMILTPQQRNAVEKCSRAYEDSASGFLFAHMMGSGKTLSTLVVLDMIATTICQKFYAVVVCSLTLEDHWLKELTKWKTHCTFHFEAYRFTDYSAWMRYGGVLFVQRDTFSKKITNNVHVVAVDEAHDVLSNKNTFYMAMSKSNINFRLLLSGTPLNNNITDYCNIMTLLHEEATRETFAEILQGISKEVNELKRSEKTIEDFMRKYSLHAAVLRSFVEGKIDRIDEPHHTPLYQFRVLFNVPPFTIEECAGIKYYHKVNTQVRPQQLQLAACLIEHFMKTKKESVLVFSKYIKILQDICTTMREHGIECHLLTGDIQSKDERQRIINDFLISDKAETLCMTQVGCTGLNLQNVTRVILLQPSWTHADDLQALTRAHRYGQQRAVYVYRLVAAGTAQQSVYNIAFEKNMLSRSALDNADKKQFDKYQFELPQSDECTEITEASARIDSTFADETILRLLYCASIHNDDDVKETEPHTPEEHSFVNNRINRYKNQMERCIRNLAYDSIGLSDDGLLLWFPPLFEQHESKKWLHNSECCKDVDIDNVNMVELEAQCSTTDDNTTGCKQIEPGETKKKWSCAVSYGKTLVLRFRIVFKTGKATPWSQPSAALVFSNPSKSV